MAQVFGKVHLSKIINESKNTVHFTNPQGGKQGDIPPGKSNEDACKGYIPQWDSPPRYQISYYNETLKRLLVVDIKDLGGNTWLTSFAHEDRAELIAELRAQPPNSNSSHFQITFKDHGFEIFDLDAKVCKGGLYFWK